MKTKLHGKITTTSHKSKALKKSALAVQFAARLHGEFEFDVRQVVWRTCKSTVFLHLPNPGKLCIKVLLDHVYEAEVLRIVGADFEAYQAIELADLGVGINTGTR